MKKILFPTDFSETAKTSFQYAIQLAEVLEAEITLIHIYQLPFIHSEGIPPEQFQEMLDDLEAKVMEKLAQFASKFEEDTNVKMKTDAIFGAVISREITAFAEQQNIDLIIMGTREKHTIVQKWLGSVTSTTMIHAACPVLAIPPHSTYQPIEHIAYASDFSPTDTPAVKQLMQIAGLLGAQIHFLHVETNPDIGEIEDTVIIDNFPFDHVEFAVVNAHSIQEGLNKYIADRQIQVLALYIPKRRLWERLFHRSISKKLSFQSTVPLLTFLE